MSIADPHLDRPYVIVARDQAGAWYTFLSYFDQNIRDSWLAGLRREAPARELRAARRYYGGWVFEDS